MNVWPAIVSVPVRALVPVFAVALKLTEPLPVPEAPAVTVSHAALLVADQVQPAAAVTADVPPLADAGSDALTGEIDIVQDDVAACVTVNV